MTALTKHWPPLLAIALCTLGGLAATPFLPQRIPVHWGIDGTISSYTGKTIGVYLNPAGMAVAYLFFSMIPHTDKRRVRELREIGIYEPLRNTAVYAFGFAQVLALGISLGVVRESANYLIGLACIFIALGVEAVTAGLLDPLRPHLKRLFVLLDKVLPKRARQVQIASAFGLLGTLLFPYAILWLLLPMILFVVIPAIRESP